MDERRKWPESSRFVDDFEVRLACAELMAELLMSYGVSVEATIGDTRLSLVKTPAVDACDEIDYRFRQALRVSECLHSYTSETVSAGSDHTVRHPDPLSDATAARAFSLELGTVDLETVDREEIIPSDYEWHSLALAVIDLGDEDLIGKDHITLIDTEDGTELTDERALELHSLLTALASELRANNFSDVTTLDEISPPKIDADGTHKFGPLFRAIDFIEGVGCDQCLSDHIVCSHNGSAN